MTGAKLKKDSLTLVQVQNLLSQVALKNEPVQLFLSNYEVVSLPLFIVGPINFALGSNARLKSLVAVNQAYHILCQIDASVLTFVAVVEKSDKYLTLHFEKNAQLTNRREAYRARPTGKGSYFALINSFDSRAVNEKFDIVDLSINGMKLALPSRLDQNALKATKTVCGKLHLAGKLIEFNGKVMNLNPANLSLQFINLGDSDKNEIWVELMKWYRLKKEKTNS